MNKFNLLKIATLVFIFIFQISIGQTNEDENKEEKDKKQPVKIGLKVGYSLGNLNSSEDNIYTRDYSSVSGFDIGATFEFPIDKTFSVQTELNYTQRGGVREGMQPAPSDELSAALNQFLLVSGMPLITDENPLYANFKAEFDLTYLEVPVLAKFGWGEKTRFYAEVGPYVSILLKAEQLTSGTSQFYFDESGNIPVVVPNPTGNPPVVPLPAQSLDATTDIKDDLHTVNFGGVFGVGIIQQIGEKSEIYLDGRTSYSFNTIQINEVYGQSHIGGIIFSIGYAYTL